MKNIPRRLPPARLPALLLAISLSVAAHLSVSGQTPLSIPLGGNAWSSHPDDSTGGQITADGIVGWNDPSTAFTVWFRVSQPGKLNISLLASAPGGGSTISISLGGGGAMEHTLSLKGARLHECPTGSWMVRDTGYQVVVIRGLQRSGAIFANIQSLSLSGAAAEGRVAFVPDNKGDFFYWGRRGPSVHLNYDVPGADPGATPSVEWFYNEVRVPDNGAIIGSYFMADGFSTGYFGMQINSATERRILFSVWSPFATDNPAAIPDSLRVRLVRKGQDVHTGSFGNEGSGGQSYLVYPWSADRNYCFLLRAQPMSDSPTQPPAHPTSGSGLTAASVPTSSVTRFTAWFYDPGDRHWRLIASWDRPATYTWLQHLHSFLENFEPDYGDQSRSALFTNQWICDSSGHWIPLMRARFTGDNTARKGYRLDYAGGQATEGFWLRNGGFFSTPVPLDTWFTKPTHQPSPPDIDFAALP